MANISNKRKLRKNQRNNKKRKLSKTVEEKKRPEKKNPETQNPNKKKKKQKKNLGKTPISHDSDNEIVESESEKIQKLLEPYSKDKLIDFLCDSAVSNSSLFERIKATADQDVSHRKIFVHGLGWDTTQETLRSVFQSFGEIEDCKLVLDRVTGKAKGYGFVLFKSRVSAGKALKEPQKKINNRLASCQLASIGPVQSQTQENFMRKIYVSNVHAGADPQKLRTLFARFGEIEMGPLGFDMMTGKSRGFALFVYKTNEGAKKALEEPYKMFEGHQLHCQRATESKNKPFGQQQQQQNKAFGQQQQQQLPPQQQQQQAKTQQLQTTQAAPALGAVAAAPNLAMFNQHPGLNPMYNGLVANQNPGLTASSVNPMMAGAFNPGLFASSQMAGGSFGVGLGGYNGSHGLGVMGGNPPYLGQHASMNPAFQGAPMNSAFQGSYMNPAFQGMQSYQHPPLGQSSARPYGTSGSLPGYPSYLW